MNIGDLFERLSQGELSNLAIGMEGAGAISIEEQPKIVRLANAGLAVLHSRFVQRTDLVTIQMQEGVTRYLLSPVHALSNTNPHHTKPRYIIDTAEEPFVGGIIRIMAISDLDPPEDDLDPVRARAVGHNTVLVQNPRAGGHLQIEVQSSHPRLSIPVDETEEIVLAPLLEEALEAWVAARIYSGMNGEENLLKARELTARYEELCQMVKIEGLLDEQVTTGSARPRDRGFV